MVVAKFARQARTDIAHSSGYAARIQAVQARFDSLQTDSSGSGIGLFVICPGQDAGRLRAAEFANASICLR
jgi:hypothetical protein